MYSDKSIIKIIIIIIIIITLSCSHVDVVTRGLEGVYVLKILHLPNF